MLRLTEVVETFPSVRIPSESGGPATEVSLIAQLGHGAGDHLFASVASRQRQHKTFIDELDEPSAKLGATDFSRGDPTALYSFAVGPKGHPFHRHAGHRIFTAISGSAGAQLRFSSASPEQIANDPKSFLRALRFVNIPPDCMFTVRFGGEIWHQFYPLAPKTLHPVFFALSCHTNELGGDLPEELKHRVLANDADIPSLTELLPPEVATLLSAKDFRTDEVPTTSLSLDAPEGTLHRMVCNTVRGSAGFLRGAWGAWHDASGFLSKSGPAVRAFSTPPEGSLLREQFADVRIDHDDSFLLTVCGSWIKDVGATQLLAAVLEGFLLNAPNSVSGLMMLRNCLVKPLGLRTSPLGCPVSSLLSPKTDRLFAGQYPVLDQKIDADDSFAQVILGVIDKHLMFRSCVSVRKTGDDSAEILLGTRVHCKNAFGRFYMASIDYVHRRYVAPLMLRLAVDYAVTQLERG
ncbi:MAG: DUF2867 domain-containing protein [Alphaproteobacteria bacterium]|nr:DUF2867 domain-containing protein [Alphaproteobacteria bacterium]